MNTCHVPGAALGTWKQWPLRQNSSVSCNLMWGHVVQTRCCDGDRLGEQAVLSGGREVRKGLTEEVTCDLESE